MHILFVCQSLGHENTIVGDTIDRIRALKAHPDVSHVSVLTLQGEIREDIQEISHYSLKRESNGKISSLFRLFKLFFEIKKRKLDICYLYMTPTLTFFFWLLKLVSHHKVVTWFAHTKFRPWPKFNLKYLSDLWVSVVPGQTFPVKHLRIIGQGVDCESFKKTSIQKEYDLITIGRITPAKNLELMVEALNVLKTKHNKTPKLVLCGDPYVESDHEYKKMICDLVDKYGLNDQMIWAGNISREELPNYLNKTRFFLFTVAGGIGKATMEALAVGLPSIISFPEARSFFPNEWADKMVCDDSPEAVANLYLELDGLGRDEEDKLSNKIVQFVHDNYSFEAFTNRLVKELKEVRS